MIPNTHEAYVLGYQGKRLQWLAAQLTNQWSVGGEKLDDFSTYTWGLRGMPSYRGAMLTTAFTKTGDAAILKPFGGTPGFTSSMIFDFDRSNYPTSPNDANAGKVFRTRYRSCIPSSRSTSTSGIPGSRASPWCFLPEPLANMEGGKYPWMPG